MQVQKPKKGYKLVKSLFGKYEEIPEEWEMKLTSEILKITMGQSPPSESYNQEEKGLPFYQGVTDFGTIYPNPTVWCTDSRKIAEENSILFSVRAPVGEINLTKKKCCLGRGVAALNPLENDLLYCYYLVNQNKKRFSVYSQGTTYDAINRDEIANTKLPYTKNIKEQQKIASILSNVDSLIQQTQKEIEQTQRLKKGLMQRLLTKGIGHKKFKKVKSLFGKYEEIPEEWELKKITEIAIKLASGGTPSTARMEFWNGKIPWTKSAVLTQHYINKGERFITKEGLENSSSVIIPKNNLLVASRVSMGNLSINTIDIAINQDITGIIIDKTQIFVEYLYWYLLKSIQKLTSFSQGSTIQGFTRKELSEFLIILPTLKEQQKIASILSNVDSKIQKRQEYKSKLESLKKGLMQKLLTGQIRVRV